MLTVTARSLPGPRPINEDSLLWDPDLGLLAVADGMGGHNAGEVASRTALETVRLFLHKSAHDHDCTWPFGVNPTLSFASNRLSTAARLANRRVFTESEQRAEYTGMGTTLVAALADGARITFTSVGDSRVYVLSPPGDVQQISHDDSLVALLVRESGLQPAAFAQHPMRHVLTSVIGAKPELEVTVEDLDLAEGQVLLICTDGLYGALDSLAIAAAVCSSPDLETAADTLLAAAVGSALCADNVSFLLARHDPDHASPADALG